MFLNTIIKRSGLKYSSYIPYIYYFSNSARNFAFLREYAGSTQRVRREYAESTQRVRREYAGSTQEVRRKYGGIVCRDSTLKI